MFPSKGGERNVGKQIGRVGLENQFMNDPAKLAQMRPPDHNRVPVALTGGIKKGGNSPRAPNHFDRAFLCADNDVFVQTPHKLGFLTAPSQASQLGSIIIIHFIKN